MSNLWFDLCDMYLTRLDRLDESFARLDTMPTLTKQDKEEKRGLFELTMRVIKLNRETESKLDELWGLDI
jgi:hypothetical protein